jgi:hypothetical protein
MTLHTLDRPTESAKAPRPRAAFERRGKHLVVTARITLHPVYDQLLIDLLRNAPPNGMAKIMRSLMRAGLQADETSPSEPDGVQVEVMNERAGVILSGHAARSTCRSVVVYRTDIPALIGALATAYAQLVGSRQLDDPGMSLPLQVEE